MFEGAGTPELELHGARKSIVFVKFFQRSPGETEVVVITGGSEDILGFDFGRYKNIIGYVAVVFEGSESRKDDEVFLDPLEADDAFMAGSFEYNENHLEEALKLYTEAVRKDPRMVDGWYMQGVVLAELGRKTEALESLQKALNLKPDDKGVKEELTKLQET